MLHFVVCDMSNQFSIRRVAQKWTVMLLHVPVMDSFFCWAHRVKYAVQAAFLLAIPSLGYILAQVSAPLASTIECCCHRLLQNIYVKESRGTQQMLDLLGNSSFHVMSSILLRATLARYLARGLTRMRQFGKKSNHSSANPRSRTTLSDGLSESMWDCITSIIVCAETHRDMGCRKSVEAFLFLQVIADCCFFVTWIVSAVFSGGFLPCAVYFLAWWGTVWLCPCLLWSHWLSWLAELLPILLSFHATSRRIDGSAS